MLQIGSLKILERLSASQFVIDVIHRPQHIGKRVVFHQIRILEKPEETVLLLFESGAKKSEVVRADVDADRIRGEERTRSAEILVVPIYRDPKLPVNLFAVRGIIPKRKKDIAPGFGEKFIDDNTDLLQHSLLFAAYQDRIDSESHKKDVDRNKGQIFQKIEPRLLGSSENEILDQIHQ